MGEVVRLHDGLRALYPQAVVFGGIGTSDVVRELDRMRALLGSPSEPGDQSSLGIAVDARGVAIWAEAPVLTLRFGQLAAIGVHDEALEITALVAGAVIRVAIPLAVPAEAEHIGDRVLVALAG